jgi:hypothetical protein
MILYKPFITKYYKVYVLFSIPNELFIPYETFIGKYEK